MTRDPVEGKWKAGQFGPIKERGSYFQAIFHGKLVSALAGIGYRLVPHGGTLEVEGFQRMLSGNFPAGRRKSINWPMSWGSPTRSEKRR